jgi:phage repressor protein C with HTH and peptisase S24 domain
MSADTFSSRLRDAMNGRSLRSFGAGCGLSEGALRKYLSEKSEPGMAALVAMAHTANVCIEWLATGDGPKYPKIRRVADEERTPSIDQDEFVLVPARVAHIDSGHRMVESERIVDFLAFRRCWVESHALQADRLALVSARGDSMEPTIRDGFLLLVDLRQQEITADAIYVLYIGDELVAKRCQKLLTGAVKIKSDNPAYDEQVLPADQVGKLQIVGRVVWGGGWM